MRLQKVVPPRLPESEPTYTRRAWDVFNNVLRLYFNRLSDVLNNVIGVNGGQYVDCPYGLFFSTDPQTLSGANTAHAVLLPTTYLSNAVTVEGISDTDVTVSVNGVYNFQFSAQLKSTSSSSKQVWIWLQRNGLPIGYSTHQYTLAGSGNHMEVSWNFDIDLQEGQYISIVWASDSVAVTLEATAATSPHPGIPSAVLAVNFVAPLPDILPTPP
jgi:hypothetical protein